MLYKEESSLGLKLERMKLKEEDSQFYSKGHDNREETQL